MPAAWVSPTAFTTRPTTAALSASASPTIRRPSPPIPLLPGGNARGRAVTAAPPNFWFWPILVAVTAVAHGLGKPKSKSSCATHLASPLPSRIIPPVLPNGIPSSIVCSPKSPNTGPPSHSSATTSARLHSQYQHQDQLGCYRISRPQRVSNRSQTRPHAHLLARSETRQTPAAMELHHCT